MWQTRILKKTSWAFALSALLCIVLVPVLINVFRIKTADAYLESLPKPSQLLKLSPEYNEIELKGLSFNPYNPDEFKFILDSGDERKLSEKDAQRILSYFFAALSVPEDMLWVNLSPYESDRIIDDSIAKTDLGRDFLAQDYLLKQISSSLTHPESQTGEAYWTLVNSGQKIDNRVFSKVWIAPGKTAVAEGINAVYISQAQLDLLSEQDYLANKLNGVGKSGKSETNAINAILEPLRNEINTSKRFARLRQIYQAIILAKWFKYRFQDSSYHRTFDTHKTQFLELSKKDAKEKVYKNYKEAFEKGVYKDIKRNHSNQRQLYFSGGMTGKITNLQISSSIAKEKFVGKRVEVSCSAVLVNRPNKLELPDQFNGLELNDLLKDIIYDRELPIKNHDLLIQKLDESGVFNTRFENKGTSVKFSFIDDHGKLISHKQSTLYKDKWGGELDVYFFTIENKIYVLTKLKEKGMKSQLASVRSYIVSKLLEDTGTVPKIYAYGYAKNKSSYDFYTVSEFAGEDLNEHILRLKNNDKQISLKESLKILYPILTALKKMHDHDIPHWDIKARNILVDDQMQSKLIDFTLSAAGGLRMKEGVLQGTIEYMAPENIKKYFFSGVMGKSSKGNDIYALGQVLFEMLTASDYEQSIKNGENLIKDVRDRYRGRNFNKTRDRILRKYGLPLIARYLLEGMLEADPFKRTSIDKLITQVEILSELYENPKLSLGEHVEQIDLLENLIASANERIAYHEKVLARMNRSRNRLFRSENRKESFFNQAMHRLEDSLRVLFSKKMRKKNQQYLKIINYTKTRIQSLNNEIAEYQSLLSASSLEKHSNGGIDLADINLEFTAAQNLSKIELETNDFLGLSFQINSISYE